MLNFIPGTGSKHFISFKAVLRVNKLYVSILEWFSIILKSNWYLRKTAPFFNIRFFQNLTYKYRTTSFMILMFNILIGLTVYIF